MKRTAEIYKNTMETQKMVKSLYDDVKSRMVKLIEEREELNDSFLLREYPVMSKQDMDIIAQAVDFFNQQMKEEEISIKAYIPGISTLIAFQDIDALGKGFVDIFIIIK